MSEEYYLPKTYVGANRYGRLLKKQILDAAKRHKLSLSAYFRVCHLAFEISPHNPTETPDKKGENK